MKVKLTDVCTPKQWKTIATSELLAKGYPVYGANGLIGYYSEYNHEQPVVTITCRGATCGAINVTVPQSYVNGNAMCLDDLCPNILRDYLYYCLLHYNFSNVISGSAQPQITRQGLDKVEIEVCLIEQQYKIVDTLQKIESVITARQQELQKLDELVKARFVELFGTIHDNKFGYEIKTLQDVCEQIKDGTHQTPTYTDDSVNGYKFLSSKDVTTGKIDWTHLKYIPEELHNELYARIAPKKGDILLAKNGTTGIAAIVDRDEIFDIYVSLALLRPIEINSVYLWAAINSVETKQQFDSSLKGIGVPNLHLSEIKKTRIIVPPLEEQIQFATFVAQIDKSKVVVDTQLLFDSLMQKYSG